ncbi:MAG: heat shock protein 82, partial [Olpidium bornovanus]
MKTKPEKKIQERVHSLYKTKEIFLRELISNASDALDKIRFLALTDNEALATNSELEITVKADKANRILVIRDTGVGMTKKELKENLGTIAKSGTSEFLSHLEKGGRQSDVGLIGEFGVGFYSIFLVADRAVVVTKHNNDTQYIWESSDVNDFTIAKDPRGNTIKRGTEITLHVKEDAVDFLEEDTLRKLIKKYSQFINFPIRLWATKTEVVEEEDEENDPKEPAKEDEKPDADVEDVDEENEEKPKKKTKQVTREDWELMNGQKAIWLRDPKEITEAEYTEFYKAFTKDVDAPITHSHFKAEGD